MTTKGTDDMTTTTCAIWGSGYQATMLQYGPQLSRVMSSDRVGGAYEITHRALPMICKLEAVEKARLTTWLVDQRSQGVELPIVTPDIVEFAARQHPVPVHERAERLLKYLAVCAKSFGEATNINWETAMLGQSDWRAMAWSESTTPEEVSYLLKYLITKTWVSDIGQSHYVVTLDGHARIASQSSDVDSAQAFVAMWFDDSMTECYENGVAPGIEDSGYTARRIDQKEHINRIDDEIIAEIRRSRFLVADFTRGCDGARGGVYYEAGFASGLGRPVIYICREDMVDKLAFDTRQYNHILWKKPGDLREALRNRILAVIGEGPGVHAASNTEQA